VHVLHHVPYDPIRAFTPISLLATAPQVFVLNPSFPAKTLKEFIAAAQTQPGKLNYGSGGSGSITHLAGELFKLAAKVDVVQVPYKSIAIAVTDVLSGSDSGRVPDDARRCAARARRPLTRARDFESQAFQCVARRANFR
jgi:tripartite-type tricarboxylate transporter receptor subunit TctC